jgi:hypothetical protein
VDQYDWELEFVIYMWLWLGIVERISPGSLLYRTQGGMYIRLKARLQVSGRLRLFESDCKNISTKVA